MFTKFVVFQEILFKDYEAALNFWKKVKDLYTFLKRFFYIFIKSNQRRV